MVARRVRLVMTAGIPPAVRSYSAYLRTRTGLATEIAVNGKAATITASRGGSELCISFAPVSGAPDWQMTGMQVTSGGQVASFAQGQLGGAIAALLAGHLRG
jgi:hypothetical protein